MRKIFITLFLLTSIGTLPNVSYAGSLSCSKCTYCSKIKSCKLANYCLTRCGKRRLDRDRDGIPCENVCGKTQRQFKIRRNR